MSVASQLERDIQRLNGILADVLRRLAPPGHLNSCEELIAACRAGSENGFQAARKQIATLGLQDIREVIKSLTLRFHLRNQAEKVAIIRVNRNRSKSATKFQPRTESIAEAILQLKSRGVPIESLESILARIDIQPTLTAHPTESRRRTLLRKQRDIAQTLIELGECAGDVARQSRLEAKLHELVLLLYGTDEVRVERLSVREEIQNSLYFLTNAIMNAVPRILQDVSRAVALHYESPPEVLPKLSYCTWIGGDRDGNPFVTPALTRASLQVHRRHVLRLYRRKTQRLLRHLSLSDRRVTIPDELQESLDATQLARWLPEQTITRMRHEPFRLKLMEIRARLAAAVELYDAYSPTAFAADLKLIAHTLQSMNLPGIVNSSGLARLQMQASVFGFHLATLDIRQHSAVHEHVVAELLHRAGLCSKYGELQEEGKQAALTAALAGEIPDVQSMADLSLIAADVLEVLRIVAQARRQDPKSIGSYIISMTDCVSDVLEVLWLMRVVECPSLDLVPLFETINDLTRAGELLDAMLAHQGYRAHVAQRGDFQEIMLGYSDSNKDGGFVMSSWLLQKAQSQLADVCRRHDVSFRFFHGRGGTVGRGGGRSNRAILATPPDSRTGRIRMTEQGEVISFRYALPDVAHRHLEQITNAMILAEADPPGHAEPTRTIAGRLLDQLGAWSMEAYRALIDDPQFWPWFTEVSPIAHISALPIASRPVARTSKAVHFENLRAIPWVFAWTQMRFNVPGWYGIGAALSCAIDESRENLSTFANWYRQWEYFRTLIDNAQQEMARARLPVAACYDKLSSDSLYPRIQQEYGRARSAILRITGQHELLDNNPTIQRSIEQRNEATDVLNLLQIELLKRFRDAADEDEKEQLRRALFASINGIASAMQSTG